MTSIKKKSRKKLYGLLIENLEDCSKKTLKTISSINLLPALKDESKNMDDGHQTAGAEIDYESIIPHIFRKHRRKAKNIARKSKILISYHRARAAKIYYGSKTQRSKKSRKGFIKYYRSIQKKYDRYDVLIKKKDKLRECS